MVGHESHSIRRSIQRKCPGLKQILIFGIQMKSLLKEIEDKFEEIEEANVTGNLDGIVGGTTPAAGSFTEIASTGNITMTGKFLKQF